MLYEKVIYISHPYKGLVKNEIKVANTIKYLMKKHPTYLFVSPIHSFSFAYHSVPYEDGMDMCLWLLNQCDEMWVFGEYEKSRGCLEELSHCREKAIPYTIMEDIRWELPNNDM